MLVDAEEGGATTPAGVTLVILYEQHSEEEEELDDDESCTEISSAPPSASSRNAESLEDATASAEGAEPWCTGMRHGSNFCSVVLLLFALLINIIYVSRA